MFIPCRVVVAGRPQPGTGTCGSDAASAFVDALESGLRHIASAPNSGSLRFGYELGIPELRAWRLRRQPYVVFYVPLDDRLDVWRVLRERRDIPASFGAGG